MIVTATQIFLVANLAYCFTGSHIAGNFSAAKRHIELELKKRAFHEEYPLINMADDHPLEFYWLPPYYPSRM